MKKIAVFLFVLVFALLLVGCQAQGFVELPADVTEGLGLVVLLAVSFVLARLIALIPVLAFLDQFRLPLSAAIAVQLIALLQNAIPDQYGDFAVHALRAVLSLLALVGVGLKFKQRGLLPE